MSVERKRPLNSFVGSPIERIEDLRFLRGKRQYVDDISPPGLLHAVIVRSSVAHGVIRGIDGAAARARPGVHAVITAADIGKVPTIPLRQEQLAAFRPYEQPVIATGKVRKLISRGYAKSGTGNLDAATDRNRIAGGRSLELSFGLSRNPSFAIPGRPCLRSR